MAQNDLWHIQSRLRQYYGRQDQGQLLRTPEMVDEQAGSEDGD